jgi:hypothetical protein
MNTKRVWKYCGVERLSAVGAGLQMRGGGLVGNGADYVIGSGLIVLEHIPRTRT